MGEDCRSRPHCIRKGTAQLSEHTVVRRASCSATTHDVLSAALVRAGPIGITVSRCIAVRYQSPRIRVEVGVVLPARSVSTGAMEGCGALAHEQASPHPDLADARERKVSAERIRRASRGDRRAIASKWEETGARPAGVSCVNRERASATRLGSCVYDESRARRWEVDG
jgi:hypothetical protein